MFRNAFFSVMAVSVLTATAQAGPSTCMDRARMYLNQGMFKLHDCPIAQDTWGDTGADAWFSSNYLGVHCFGNRNYCNYDMNVNIVSARCDSNNNPYTIRLEGASGYVTIYPTLGEKGTGSGDVFYNKHFSPKNCRGHYDLQPYD